MSILHAALLLHLLRQYGWESVGSGVGQLLVCSAKRPPKMGAPVLIPPPPNLPTSPYNTEMPFVTKCLSITFFKPITEVVVYHAADLRMKLNNFAVSKKYCFKNFLLMKTLLNICFL